MAAMLGGIDMLQEEILCLEQNLQQYTTLNSDLVAQRQIAVELLESERLQGPQSDLPRRLLEAEARLEAERVRHAETEAEWKQEQRRLIAEMENRRNSNEKAQTMRVFLEEDPEHTALVKSLELLEGWNIILKNPDVNHRKNIFVSQKICALIIEHRKLKMKFYTPLQASGINL